jgi:hypothetical protein
MLTTTLSFYINMDLLTQLRVSLSVQYVTLPSYFSQSPFNVLQGLRMFCGKQTLFPDHQRELLLKALQGLMSDGVLGWRCYVIHGRQRWLRWLLSVVVSLNFGA